MWINQKIRHINPFGEYMFEKNGNRVKTYASILLDNQVPEKLIADLMGHTDIQCTNKFYGRNRKTNEMKAEILNNIPEFQIING